LRTDTDTQLGLNEIYVHSHRPYDIQVERHILRVKTKRKAVDNISSTELQSMVEENLEPNNNKLYPKQYIDEEDECIRLCQNHLKKPMKTYGK
jgi:signal recognition particle subunit SEC65